MSVKTKYIGVRASKSRASWHTFGHLCDFFKEMKEFPIRIKNASTRTKMVAVFVRSRTKSTQRGGSLATVVHWLLTGITTRGTGVDLRYQMDV